MDVTIDRLGPDEAEQDARLRSQAFDSDLAPYDSERPMVDPERVHVAKLDGRLVGTLTVLPLAQWWAGRSLPMGGVAGVAVAPHVRGHGLARRLTAEALSAMRDRGEVISALYPTASPLYRSVGYEFGGRWERTTVSIDRLATLSPDHSAKRLGLTIEELKPGQLERMRPVYDELAADSNGWLDRTQLFWDRLNHSINPEKSNSFGYVISDENGRVVSGLTVTQRPAQNPDKLRIDVGGPYASNPDGFLAAINLVAGWGTMAETATLNLPVESLAAHLGGATLSHADSWQWMFRLVDVQKALSGRGYGPHLQTRFEFDLTDEVAPWNTGRWLVAIEDGQATVERTASGPGASSAPSLDIQTLSCLFTGFIGPLELYRSGRMPDAERVTIDAMAAAFQGPAPRLADFF